MNYNINESQQVIVLLIIFRKDIKDLVRTINFVDLRFVINSCNLFPEPKISFRIIKTNILNHLPQQSQIGRYFTGFDIIA